MRVTDRQTGHFDEDLESKYEILDVLGGGGMGRVLRARHRQLKRLVAIKLLQHDLRASESVTRFLREARAAAQIRSQHVAHVLDAGLLRSGQPYIVMEYLQGQDLSSLVAIRGRLPIEQAVGFVLQALEAIAEAHSLEIIHRDIKPGNLFATRSAGGDTTIKVVDFGLAKTSQAFDTLDPGVTERGAVLGTPSYMAPEQFVDAQNVDARADVWGIGATLFELLAGAPPFSGASLPQVYTAVMHQPIPQLRERMPEIPEALERVVSRCLTRDREARYADVAELAAALEPFAPASARAHVDRIERVLSGARDSSDTLDRDLAAQIANFTEPPSERDGVDRSASFPTGGDSTRAALADVRGEPEPSKGAWAGKRLVRYSAWLALIACALFGVIWAIAAARSSEDPVQAEDRPIPAPTAEESIGSTEVSTSSVVEPEGAAALPPIEPPVPVPTPPVLEARPTSDPPNLPRPSKRKRAKAAEGPSEKSSRQSLYEKYP